MTGQISILSKVASVLGLAVAGLGLLSVVTASGAHAADAPAAVTCEQARTTTSQSPLVPTVIDETCAVVPFGFAGAIEQPSFDLTAWLTFVAVNWPVDPKICAADPGASILTKPSQPTWLSYATDTSVFVPKGQVPAPWCGKAVATGEGETAQADVATVQRKARIARLPEKVRALAEAHPEVTLYLSHNAKGAGFLRPGGVSAEASLVPADGIIQATGQPVVDQHGRFVRYGVYMNREEYDYLVPNDLWTAAGQKAAATISFPKSDPKTGKLGAMELKAAWKIIGKNDDPSRFLIKQAIVFNDEDGAPSPGANPVTVGLVGLHLIQKTYNADEWIWATFEQLDNDTKSFFDPHCLNCPHNIPPNKPYVELSKNGEPRNAPTQVVSVLPKGEDSSAVQYSKDFQALLAGTPWAFYRLVSAQWLGEFGSAPKPAQLGNSVIETYVKPGNATYGCLQCHNNASAYPSGKPSDRSFIIFAQQ